MVKRLLLFLIPAVVLITVILAGAIGFWAIKTYPQQGPLAQETLLYIQSGTSARKIADELVQVGAFNGNEKYIFLAAVKLRHANLQAGEYQLPVGISIKDALKLIENGRVYQRQITLPEGLTSSEIVALIMQAPALEGEITQDPAEGSLLPETYNYARGETRTTLLTRMQKAMTDEMVQVWTQRDPDLPLKSPEEMVTLASIVEKETGIATERARVAGVFINRLRQGIPLQSDPTVIYALTQGKDALKRGLSLKDLQTASPYNTYKVSGLPPGPIANPGRESLAAVAHPEKHDWIYFVADGSGGHAFAKTLKEHNKNVSNWRKISP